MPIIDLMVLVLVFLESEKVCDHVCMNMNVCLSRQVFSPSTWKAMIFAPSTLAALRNPEKVEHGLDFPESTGESGDNPILYSCRGSGRLCLHLFKSSQHPQLICSQNTNGS